MYQKNGYVVLSQVRNGTGFKKKPRTADMMIFSTWPSRGLHCEGIEIKVSRSDLQAELANPQKAEDIAKYCQFWWLAVPDDLITPAMMIPPGWGIIAVNENGKASVAKQAASCETVPMDTLLCCSVIRNFSENYTANDDVQEKVKAATEKAVKEAADSKSHRQKEAQEALAVFQKETGVNLLTDRGNPIWDIKGAGEAVRTLMAMRSTPAEKLKEISESLKQAAEVVETAMVAVGAVVQSTT